MNTDSKIAAMISCFEVQDDDVLVNTRENVRKPTTLVIFTHPRHLPHDMGDLLPPDRRMRMANIFLIGLEITVEHLKALFQAVRVVPLRIIRILFAVYAGRDLCEPFKIKSQFFTSFLMVVAMRQHPL